MTAKNRILLVYVTLIIGATVVPGRTPQPFAGSDKVAHAVMFFVLGMLSSWNAPKKHVIVITGACLLAFLTETLQLMVPGRFFEWWDLAADGIGVLAGWTGYQLVRAAR